MLHYIVPSLIGAVIGYLTNYIAVKMLFRPRREIRLFGRALPFTPGAIPKNKPRLAKAVGDVVENTFFNEKAISERFLTDEAVNRAVNQIVREMDRPVSDVGMEMMGSRERYERILHRVSGIVTEALLQDLQRSDIVEEIAEECIEKLSAHLKGSMFGMFLTDNLMESAKNMIQQEIRREIDERGEEFLSSEVESRLWMWAQESPSELAFESGYSDERFQAMVRRIYQSVIRRSTPLLVQKLHISAMIEAQINAMSSEELEELVLSVMKNELRLIVNLGALIGLVLGMVNLLFL